MRLKRIDARAFGAFADCKLGELGEGLTVVLGPNESGKTTYAALVRQVLYGFPDKRTKDRSYAPKASDPMGSLVFRDSTGEWMLTRAGSSKRGAVTVDTISGSDRPELLNEVVGSVTEQTFRIVFGFGLDELDQIESGSDKAILDRLYAGSTGLHVNPMDIREKLDTAAGALFKPGRGKAEVNDLISVARDLKGQIRDIESRAKDHANDSARLAQIEERLEPLRRRRDECDSSRIEVERALERARGIERERADASERVAEVQAFLDERRRDAERTVFDKHLLDVAPDIEAVLTEESGAKQHTENAAQQESRAAELMRSAQALPAAPTTIDIQAARAKVESQRDRNTRLEAEVDGAVRSAESLSAVADSYEQASRDAGTGSRKLPLLAIVTIAIGLIAVAAGVLMQQWIAAGTGGAVLLLGLVALFGGRGRSGSISVEVLSKRAEANGAVEAAQRTKARRDSELAEWRQWLAQHGLDSRDEQPQAVVTLLDDIQRRLSLEEQAASLMAEAERHRALAAEWATRLTSLVRGPLGISETSPEPHALAIRARDALAAAKAARERKQAAITEIENAEAELKRIAVRNDDRERELAEIANQRGVSGDVVAGLESALAEVTQNLADATQAYDECSREQAALAATLAAIAGEDELAIHRQRLEGVDAQAGVLADRYLVEALAVQLIDKARERFERDRQPQLVQTAERIFSEMTQGAYKGVRVPLDRSAITVIGRHDDVKTTAVMSTGAAEQLYLALRVGMIESFGEQGPHLPVLMDDVVVNYDSERMVNATAAIQALAQKRQVIFFTCHDATASVLSSAVPGTVTLRLDRCV